MESANEQRHMSKSGMAPWLVPASTRARVESKSPSAFCISTSGGLARLSLARRLDVCFEAVRQRLSAERLHHILGVCHASVALAEIHGLDPVAAAVASFLHDLAKETASDDLRADLERRRRAVGPEDEAYPKLWHALASAVWAEQDFGVSDPDILQAIRLHPTGDAGMSKLAQVVFLADYTDPTRDWDHVEDLRRLARTDFSTALGLAIESKIEHVRARGYAVHPRALRALAAYGRPDQSLHPGVNNATAPLPESGVNTGDSVSAASHHLRRDR